MSTPAKRPFWMATGWRLIGVGLLLVVLWRVGAADLAAALWNVDPLPVVLAALLATAVLLLRSLRWRLLCAGLGIPLPIGEAVRLYLLATFVAAITPGRVGDLVKAYYIRDRRAEAGLAAGIASVVYDRFLDLGQVCALALGAVVILPGVPPWAGPALVALGLAGFVAGTVWRPTREGLLARPLNWALRRLPGADGVSPPAPPAAHVLLAQVLTAASVAGFAGASVLLARGLSIDASAWSLAVLSALGALVGLMPITVLGIGTRDALYVAAAPFLGASSEAMLALSLLLLAMYVLNSVTGWAAWFLSPPRDRQPPAAR
ncbi:MAG TPA: lysylphosphatidylglycerol synthase transmembrane domain-containing protein [Acidobacteriota bacterium]